jgi:hypothetical protein
MHLIVILITLLTLCCYMFRQFIAIFRELLYTSYATYMLAYVVGKIGAVDGYTPRTQTVIHIHLLHRFYPQLTPAYK